jgi:alpha-glucosidase
MHPPHPAPHASHPLALYPHVLHYPLADRRCHGGGATVSLRLPRALQPVSVYVRSEPNNEELLLQLEPTGVRGPWGGWCGPLRLNPADPVTRYAFKVVLDDRQLWVSEAGVTPHFPERDLHFRWNPHYVPARWVWSAVFYQIFPDRFFDGDPSNNVASGAYRYDGEPVVAKAWNELPTQGQGAREFYGGDLQGIEAKLPYLQDLGVTALYLNPIFTSPSSHKYDTTDYFQVDPHFGGNGAFASLCAALRARGMRVVLDAVVNHTSERHPWFDRYGEHPEGGAYGHPTAATRGFYTFVEGVEIPEGEGVVQAERDAYHGWLGVPTLPVLNFAHPVVQRRVYGDRDAILRVWLRPPYRIDGWRFDVAHMIGEGPGARHNAHYLRAFRRAVRDENPEAYVLGEHFFEATPWLQGDQEDGAMNYYGFTAPLRAFLTGRDHRGHPVCVGAADLGAMLARARAKLPFEHQLSQLNLLGSHDLPRLQTELGGDTALHKLAATALLTYIGVPCLYYGDEVGLQGGRDPDNRRPFPWDEAVWDQDLRAHYRRLIALRRGSRTLQEGGFAELYARGDVYAFARLLGDDLVVVALNRGPQARVALPLSALGCSRVRLRSLFDGAEVEAEGALEVTLAARASAVWCRVTPPRNARSAGCG